jgi:hypothetical protein
MSFILPGTTYELSFTKSIKRWASSQSKLSIECPQCRTPFQYSAILYPRLDFVSVTLSTQTIHSILNVT